MFERMRVIAGFELAESQERPSGSGLVFEFDEFRESAAGVFVLVAVISDGAEKPPAFGPVGLQLESLAVESGCFCKPVRFSSGGGFGRQFVECCRSGRKRKKHRTCDTAPQKHHLRL